MQLFEEFDRTDPSPAEAGEDSFSFMNRVDQPFWQRIREELNRWFSNYPPEGADDLHSRFQERAADQHYAAWWELYLHKLFRQLGFEVQLHPELKDTTSRPDFRVCRGEESFLLEAATTFSGIVPSEERHGQRENWIKAAINRAKNPNFFVALDFQRVGLERPADREIIAPLEEWLRGLNPDDVSAQGLTDAPELRLQPRDWDFVLTAIPIKPEARGKPDHRLLGMESGFAGYVNDVDKLSRTLERKRRQAGQPEEPFVIAVLLMSGFMDDEDIEQALLGRVAYQFSPDDFQQGRWIRQRNGFWMRGNEPRSTRVSAVITGTNLMPWTLASVWPRLWPNPWAQRPLEVDLPFPKGIADQQGVVAYVDVDEAPHESFGLPADWPGPEAPFEDQ